MKKDSTKSELEKAMFAAIDQTAIHVQRKDRSFDVALLELDHDRWLLHRLGLVREVSPSYVVRHWEVCTCSEQESER